MSYHNGRGSGGMSRPNRTSVRRANNNTIQQCNTPSDCPPGQTCQNGACVGYNPNPGTGGNVVGPTNINQFMRDFRNNPDWQMIARDNGYTWSDASENQVNNIIYCALCCFMASCCNVCSCGCPEPETRGGSSGNGMNNGMTHTPHNTKATRANQQGNVRKTLHGNHRNVKGRGLK